MALNFENKRQFARAPLRSFVLYSDEGFVFKAKLLNISAGGMLLESLPHIPAAEVVPFYLDIPEMKVMHNLSDDEIFSINHYDIKRNFIRVKGKTVRRVTPTSNIDDLFVQVGSEFLEFEDKDSREIVEKYVIIFKQNIKFLKGLLEEYADEIDKRRIDKVSELLGYGQIKDLMLLHKKIVSDTQGLFSI